MHPSFYSSFLLIHSQVWLKVLAGVPIHFLQQTVNWHAPTWFRLIIHPANIPIDYSLLTYDANAGGTSKLNNDQVTLCSDIERHLYIREKHLSRRAKCSFDLYLILSVFILPCSPSQIYLLSFVFPFLSVELFQSENFS